ncbi:unnamed protein product [Hapterophycus canaliculatus]
MRSLFSALSGNARRTHNSLVQQQHKLRPASVSSASLVRHSKACGTHTTSRASTRALERQQLQMSHRSGSSSSVSEQATRRRALVQCGVVSPRRAVPDHIPKTPYYATGAVPPQDDYVSF